MRSKKELIETAKLLDVSWQEASFYDFAVNYIGYMKSQDITDTRNFFELLKLCRDKNINSVKTVFGKSGKKDNEIKAWCGYIYEKNNELKNLTIDELLYVMGYAATMAKVKKGDENNEGNEKVAKNNNKKRQDSRGFIAEYNKSQEFKNTGIPIGKSNRSK